MDTEILRQLIDMLGEVGQATQKVVILWLVLAHAKTYVFGLIWSAIGCVAIFKTFSTITWAIRANTASGKLMEAAGVSQYWYRSELLRACEVLRSHYKRESD